MARTVGKLTALAVAKEKRAGVYGDGGGLYLKVSTAGVKSWAFRFRDGGRLREMGLGPVHTVTLADARRKAIECRQGRLDGRNPLDDRRAAIAAAKVEAAKATTFRACAEAYIASHAAGWKNPKHAAQWPSTLADYVYPIFGELPVLEIDTALVMRVLDPLWRQKTETANRLRGRIEAVLDWAKTRGLRDGENPARWRGHLENLLPRKSKIAPIVHHAAMAYAEVPTFVAKLREVEGNAARALEFTILTGVRTSEALNAVWAEFDQTAGVWTIPAARMKAAREHRVPLSDRALEVLTAMAAQRSGDFVFPGRRGGRPLSNMTFLMLLRRMKLGVTAHGFRSSFRDWAGERTNFPREIAEAALAHSIGDDVEAAYRRGDALEKRRRLMGAWTAFCGTPPAERGVVTPLRRAPAQ